VDVSVPEQLRAVVREVRPGARAGRAAKVVLATRTYVAEIARVWDALTNAERLPLWFLPVSGELRPGGRYQFEGNAGGVVERCEAPERLAVTWEFGGEVSWVEVRLSAHGGATTLVLGHTAHVHPRRWSRYGPGAVGVGWDLGLYALGQHLTTGQAVASSIAPAWLSSTEGRAFVVAASNEWARAQMLDGQDPVTARAAAARTAAFYTEAPEPPGTRTEP